MKYLITSIKEIEDIITPSLVIDDLFNPFPFPKLEEQFRSCMRLYRIETFGEDYEKSPISFEEFNPRYDKFYGLNYNRLTEIIEIEEFKIDLKQLLIRHEDYFTEGIAEQLPNPSEAEFKMFLYNSLKTLKDSYDFLISTDINNNVILNVVKDELLESYDRAFVKTKNHFSVYDEIFNKFNFEANLLNSDLVENNGIDSIVSKEYIPSRDEILSKLFDGTNNKITFENYEKKLVEKKFLSKELDGWRSSSINFVRFYTHCERQKLFRPVFLTKSSGVKMLRQLYSFYDGLTLDLPNKRAKIKSGHISNIYYFL